MLVNTFGKKISASLVVKNSQFYIDVAKFVQAYTVILENPNEFLSEIGEPQIDAKKDRLSWKKLVQIMQKCDFGFGQTMQESDLLVYFNYAIEMGSISKEDKRIATIEDIADAQKNYYNFVDEAKDRAEAEFLKQHRITKLREREVAAIDSKLNSFSFQKWTAFSLMIVAVIFFCLGVAGLVFNNPLVEAIGSIIPIWSKQYVGSIILIALSVLVFWLCDRWYLSSKQEYLKLEHASELIFSANNTNFVTEQVLRYKLESLKKDLETIKNELNDQDKTFDVKNNIDKLLETNIYYKKYAKKQDSAYFASAETRAAQQLTIETEPNFDFEPNQDLEPSQEIILEGQFDEDAYNDKFETTKRKKNKENKKSEKQEKINAAKEQEIQENIRKQEEMQRQLEEEKLLKQKQEETQQNDRLEEDFAYLKQILGEDDGLQREK